MVKRLVTAVCQVHGTTWREHPHGDPFPCCETPYRTASPPPEEPRPLVMRPYWVTLAAVTLSFLLGLSCSMVPSCMDAHDAEVRERARSGWVEQWRSCDQVCRVLDLPTMSRVWTDWGVRCRCGSAGRMVIFPPNASQEDDFTWVGRQ